MEESLTFLVSLRTSQSVKSHFTWFFCAVHVPSIDSSVNLSILKHLNNKNFSSRLIEIFLFSNCFTYIPGRYFRFNLNWIRFVFLPNKIELIGSIEFDWFDWVRLSNSRFRLIELTEKVQFDNVRLPNQSNNNPTDWVRLSSIDFWFGFVRLATPGCVHRLQLKSVCTLQASSKFISTKFFQFHELT